ncbi:hypothetical protein SISSUDRAFT_1041852, partial [Sistotremastrum suecicum HHB10207 ss-3]
MLLLRNPSWKHRRKLGRTVRNWMSLVNFMAVVHSDYTYDFLYEVNKNVPTHIRDVRRLPDRKILTFIFSYAPEGTLRQY